MENKETTEHQGTKNLIPMKDRTAEERRELTKKAGKASGEARRKKRDLKNILTALFENDAPEEMTKKLKEIYPNLEVKTIEDVLNLSMIDNAAKGNVQAYNSLYDRLDGKPRQNIGLDGGEDGKPITSKVEVLFKDYEDEPIDDETVPEQKV